MLKNEIFEEVEKLLKKKGFTVFEKDKAYIYCKGSNGDYVKVIYLEGVVALKDMEKPSKVVKKLKKEALKKEVGE